MKRTKEQEALVAVEQKQSSADEATKLEPIVEEDHQSEEKSSSLYGQSSLVGNSGKPVVPKRRVTIVDSVNYTNGAGDLSTTVGRQICFFAFAFYNPAY